MYRGEPHRVSASPWGASERAKPKSAILSSGVELLSLSSRFCGFRSRCSSGKNNKQRSLTHMRSSAAELGQRRRNSRSHNRAHRECSD